MKASLPQYPFRLKNNSAVDNCVSVLSLGYPMLFHWAAFVLVVLLLLFSSVQRRLPLLALSVFLLIMIAVARYWSWQALKLVSCQLTINQRRVFSGESVEIALDVVNAKWLPLPWLVIESELPCRLVTGSKSPSPYGREHLRWITSLGNGQRVIWRHRLECKARGDYRLGPIRLRSGDMFGCFPREMILPLCEPLLVYPRIVPMERLKLPWMQLRGDRGTPRNIHEDPSRSMGARDYQHHDPFKRIHWKASARHNKLQSRQYESTTSLSLLLILDVSGFCENEKDSEDAFELAVSTTASLAYQAHLEKSSVGLIANSAPEIRISISSGQRQLLLLLEALAKIEPDMGLPLHELLQQGDGGLPYGVSLVVVTYNISSELAGLLKKLHQRGHSFLVINTARRISSSTIPHFSAFSVAYPGDLSGSQRKPDDE